MFAVSKKFNYNLVVIGAGSGGLVASLIASAVRARVALIEKSKMGGDCLNTGCVPSKTLIRSARILSDARRAHEFGFKSAQVDFEFSDVMERVRRTIRAIEPHDSRSRYESLGVECIDGEAKILSPHEVQVGGRTLTTRSIIVATGAAPVVPEIPGVESAEFLTSETVWNLKTLPKRFLILGGGSIGVEMAQAFQRLGSQVTLVEAGPRILSREDDDVSESITQRFRQEGVRVLTSHRALKFEKNSRTKTLVCLTDAGEVRVEFDQVLLALGRKARTTGFGLEELGVKLNPPGMVAADAFMRTNVPNIFVCGDVAGPYQFTHTAAHQAWYAAINSLLNPFKKFKADTSVIPWATFTDPEIARVGLNESEARLKKIPHEVSRYPLADLDRAITDGETHGFIKVLTRPGTDRILGVTIVGAHASDAIAEFVLAMKNGLGLRKILGTIHIYPTYAEMNKSAASQWLRAHRPEWALKLAERFHTWRRG